MNPGGDSLAALLIGLILTGAGFVQERFGLEWPDWTTRDGVAFQGELVDYEWSSKSITLQVEDLAGLQRIEAEELDFWSKIHLLTSAPFQDRVANHLTELEEGSGFRPRLEELKRIGMTFLSAYLILFLALNWFLAGWLHRSGSIIRWLESVAAFLVMTALAVGLVVLCFRTFGNDQVMEYLVLAASIHGVLYVFVVWAIYRSGPFRSLLWYLLCWLVALVLPVSLCGTAVAAQVHGHSGALDLAAFDLYLTEVWLKPMGLM